MTRIVGGDFRGIFMFRTTELWLEVKASDFLGINLAAGASYDATDIRRVARSAMEEQPAQGEGTASWQQHKYAVEFSDGKSLVFLSDRHPSPGFACFAKFIEEHRLIDAEPSADEPSAKEAPADQGAVEPSPADEQPFTRIVERILPIKKSVLFGRGKWQFRSGKSTLSLPITDEAWLEAFRKGRYPLSPGDALRVQLKCLCSHDESGDVIERIEEVIEVIEVIKAEATSSDL
jgi:hypothetical protein